jgi:hypothetical protein
MGCFEILSPIHSADSPVVAAHGCSSRFFIGQLPTSSDHNHLMTYSSCLHVSVQASDSHTDISLSSNLEDSKAEGQYQRDAEEECAALGVMK